MTAVVMVGAQWGDEGKGKLIDLHTESADVVVRYAGGPNAGHTLVVGDEKIILRLIPSGILRTNARCVMAQGMVVDPGVLVDEIEALEARGHSTTGRLFISDKAHLILSVHPYLDSLRETSAIKGARLGTTRRGIGPCYEDKAARRGLRTGDLRNLKQCSSRLVQLIAAWEPVLSQLGGEAPSVEMLMDELERFSARITPMLTDTSLFINQALRRGDHVLFEGAQGTLLDLDHGTFPYVTSSTSSAGGACVGAGVGPTRIHQVLGVVKAYCTRVGEGPFPTELHDALGEHLRRAGAEFGSVTGRPRRTGWLDLPALRYAARINGFDSLGLTKLDVLSQMPELKVCVAYNTPEGRTQDFPIDHLNQAQPIFESLPPWNQPLAQARAMADLPSAARDYIGFIEKEVGVPIHVISVGAQRDATIVLRKLFA